jgi:SAM-dependent methyltransferase
VPDDPGAARRDPPLDSPTWVVRAPLAAWLREEGGRAAGKRVLDVGCGVKPYAPFFAGAAAYVGVDVASNPAADLAGTVERLPVENGSFDIVLCTQVLEHVYDPAQAVRELRRVTAPGGRVLASTHGVQVYHPNPEDLWRWTHTGLERLFRANAEWSSVEVRPACGTAASVGMLLGIYVDVAMRKVHLGALGRALIAVLNRTTRGIDARSATLRQPGSGTIFANYHVTAQA